MSRLQFPFTKGLAPPGVNAIQQLIQQNTLRQAQKAQAKAESERLKAESTRRIGDSIGSGVSQIAGAFAQRSLTEQQREHQLDLMQNRQDLSNFGLPTEDLDSMADTARLELEQATEQSIDSIRYRAEFRQQIAQTQAQQAQQDKQRQAQQKQMQKAATQQRIQGWFPDPNLNYDPGTTQKMAVLRQQVQESINNPDMSLPPEQRPIETRELEKQLTQLRQMGIPKPKFDKAEITKKFMDRIPPGPNGEPGGLAFYKPDGTLEKFHQFRMPTGSKGDDFDKELVDAMKEARATMFQLHENGDFTIEELEQEAFQIMESKSNVREELRRASMKRNVLSQRRQAHTIDRPVARNPNFPPGVVPSHATQPRGNLGRILEEGGVIPRNGAPGQQLLPRAPAQQPAQKPPHPALAKITPQNLNQKAVEIIQKSGGTTDPIAIEDLKRSGMNRKEFKKSLRVGQIYTKGGDAFVWDGKEMVPMEKPTHPSQPPAARGGVPPIPEGRQRLRRLPSPIGEKLGDTSQVAPLPESSSDPLAKYRSGIPNPKAARIIKEVGGLGPLMDMEQDLRIFVHQDGTPFTEDDYKADLSRGDLVQIEGIANVWSGSKFIPLEKP